MQISYNKYIIDKVLMKEKNVYLPITFNNPSKVYFSNKKYLITTKTSPTQIVKVYFLLKKRRCLMDF